MDSEARVWYSKRRLGYDVLHGRKLIHMTSSGAAGSTAFILLACFAVILGCGSHHPESRDALDDSPMNLILIVLDTFRGDIPSYSGGAADTPTLDALARRGVWFSNARAHAPMTGPSHASLFTSLYSADHGVFENGQILGPGEGTTLAELMSASGYQTAAFVSLGVLHSRFGFDRGFALFTDDFTSQWWKNAAEMNADILPWIKQSKDQPFFLWIHYSDTHGPYTPPDQRYQEVRITQKGDVIGGVRADGRIVQLTMRPADGKVTLIAEPGPLADDARFEVRIGGEITTTCGIDATSGFVARQTGTNNFVINLPAELSFSGCDLSDESAKATFEITVERTPEENRRAYIQEAEYLDSQLGQLLDELESGDQMGNTVIVVVGDHGEGLGDHGVFKHGRQLYDSLIRVPLIFVAPGLLPEGRRVDASVSLVDVLPTVSEILSLPIVDGIRGRSLVAAIEDEGHGPHPSVGRAFHSNGKFNLESVSLGAIKYVHDINTGAEELYNLDQDPGELRDLSGDRPSDVAAMRDLLASLRRGQEANGTTIVDGEVRQLLEALGYAPSD